MAKTSKNRDIFARYGGEEFIILLPGANLHKAVEIAEKIRKIIENTFIKTKNINIKITVSIGVSEVKKEDKNLEEVVKRADIALYMAKKDGRNRVESI